MCQTFVWKPQFPFPCAKWPKLCLLVHKVSVCLALKNMTCGDFSDNGSSRLLYLNSWSAVGGTTWDELGDMALLEGVCRWGQILMCPKHMPFPFSFLSESLLSQQVKFSATAAVPCLPATTLPSMMVMDASSETLNLQLNSFISYFCHDVLSRQ